MKKTDFIKFSVLIPILFLLLCSFPGSKKGTHGTGYQIPEGWEIHDLNLADGIYKGTSAGFREGLTVEIDIRKGELISIEIISHNEIGPQFYQRPMNIIPGKIIEEQDTRVDGISGATATSMGIMSAVEDALKRARV